MTREPTSRRLRIIAAVERQLGAGEICPRCHATLADFDNRCTASLDEACPGFVALEDARATARVLLQQTTEQ